MEFQEPEIGMTASSEVRRSEWLADLAARRRRVARHFEQAFGPAPAGCAVRSPSYCRQRARVSR